MYKTKTMNGNSDYEKLTVLYDFMSCKHHAVSKYQQRINL